MKTDMGWERGSWPGVNQEKWPGEDQPNKGGGAVLVKDLQIEGVLVREHKPKPGAENLQD